MGTPPSLQGCSLNTLHPARGSVLTEAVHQEMLASARAALAAGRAAAKGGPQGTTLGDCIAAAAAPARSQRARKHDRRAPALQTLSRDDGGPLVGAVARDIVEAVVDSGAEESVAPVGLFAATVVPSPMSKAGTKYRAAKGTRIRNLGQQKVAFGTAEGHRCVMPFQVAEVERPVI